MNCVGTSRKSRILLFFSFGINLLSSTMLMAKVIHITSVDEYQRHFSHERPLVTMYTASWCGPCKQMKPHFIEAAETMPEMTFCIVDMGNTALKGIFTGILSIPTFIFSHKGTAVHREQGSSSRRELTSSLKHFHSKIKAIPVKRQPSQGRVKPPRRFMHPPVKKVSHTSKTHTKIVRKKTLPKAHNS